MAGEGGWSSMEQHENWSRTRARDWESEATSPPQKWEAAIFPKFQQFREIKRVLARIFACVRERVGWVGATRVPRLPLTQTEAMWFHSHSGAPCTLAREFVGPCV